MGKLHNSSPSPQNRPRLVGILGWLLLLQAIFLIIFSVYHFIILQFGPELFQEWWTSVRLAGNQLKSFVVLIRELFSQASTQNNLSTLIESILLLFLALLAIIAGAGFLAQKKSAWILAMLVQGFTLTLVLILYVIKKPLHTYFLMAYCVFMVVYLQHADIYKSFQQVKILTEDEA
jgi:hypothetical protein